MKSSPISKLPAPSSLLFLLLLLLNGTASGATTGALTPLSTFGSSGWLAPGRIPYLTSDNTQRGFAYNPVTQNLVIPSRSGGNFVAILFLKKFLRVSPWGHTAIYKIQLEFRAVPEGCLGKRYR